MKTYEITFITKEDEKEKPVKSILEGLGAKITDVSSLGQKTFTYPIKKEKAGFYTTVNFEIDPEKMAELNKKLGLEEEIIRFLLVSVKPAEQAAKKEIKEKAIETELAVQETEIIPEPENDIIEAPVTEIVEAEPEEVKEEKKPAKKEKKTEKVEKAKPAKPAKKVSKVVKDLTEEPVSAEERMEALDKKLEELLKD